MHEKYDTGATGMPHGTVNDPHVFIAIAHDGTVTIVAARAEMGTGAARTSLPMIVAEELDADWSRVKVVQGPGDEPRYGNQDTDGSRSVRHFLQPMRQCGAAMRLMLEMAAAKQWGVDVSQVHASNHEIVNAANGKKLGYGDVAAAASAMPMPAVDKLTFKDPANYRYIGKGNVSIVDLHDITVGKANYGGDHRLHGQVFAVIARPPVVGGKLVSFDATEAKKVPGVIKVMEAQGWQPPATKFAPLGGVAVIAKSTGAAIKGRDALKIVWDDGPNKDFNSVAYRTELENAVKAPGEVVRNEGDVDAAFKSAAKVVTRDYYTAAFVHTPMEPPVALAHVAGGKAEIWAPVQSPWGTREDIAKLLDLPVDKVRVNTMLLGGGFGRKSKCDYAQEAALLSKALGVPVQVQWTREDDVRHSFNHGENAQRIEAAVDANNKVVGWRHRSAAPSILSTFKKDVDHQFAIEVSMGLVDLPFAIPNIRCETGDAVAHSRIGWFRSVRNIPHGFAIQSFVAELAHEMGKDPKDFLLELIGPPRIVDPRTQIGKDMFWDYGEPWEYLPDRHRPPARRGGARGREGRLGQDAAARVTASASPRTAASSPTWRPSSQVAVDDKGNITVPRLTTAIDCGFHVNPERILSQIEGALGHGDDASRSTAQITFKDGRVQQSNFDDYQMLRINQSPKMTNVHIVPATYDVHASGVGEPPIPPFAPALCNAIFAATGKRVRNLPIADQLKT